VQILVKYSQGLKETGRILPIPVFHPRLYMILLEIDRLVLNSQDLVVLEPQHSRGARHLFSLKNSSVW